MSETTANPVSEETKTTFSLDYVRELRSENKTHRLRNTELENELVTAREATKKVADEYAAKEVELHKGAQSRLIRAELKSAAVRAGMVDLDGLKLLDLTKVKLNDDGEIDGADALLSAAKESKPWLFGVSNSTSSTAAPPKPAEPKVKTAKEMSAEEMQAFEAEHNIRVR